MNCHILIYRPNRDGFASIFLTEQSGFRAISINKLVISWSHDFHYFSVHTQGYGRSIGQGARSSMKLIRNNSSLSDGFHWLFLDAISAFHLFFSSKLLCENVRFTTSSQFKWLKLSVDWHCDTFGSLILSALRSIGCWVANLYLGHCVIDSCLHDIVPLACEIPLMHKTSCHQKAWHRSKLPCKRRLVFPVAAICSLKCWNTGREREKCRSWEIEH